MAQRCMEEPPQQRGPIQQLCREQPARIPHGAQLPLGKPMALGSPGLHAAWILSFFCSFYHYLKRSFAFPSVRSALRGVFWLVFFLSPRGCRRCVLPAMARQELRTAGSEHLKVFPLCCSSLCLVAGRGTHCSLPFARGLLVIVAELPAM